MRKPAIIRLTESDLHQIIKNCAHKVLKESFHREELITDAVSALNEMGVFEPREGGDTIEAEGEMYNYTITFTYDNVTKIEDTYDVPGLIDDSNIIINVEKVNARDDWGREYDVTRELKRPVEKALKNLINVMNPSRTDERW